MYRIRFHGRGGQGMKTASRILGTAFFLEGFEVQDAPRYGAERRGAPIFAYVRAAERPINERGLISTPDLVIVADDSLVAVPTAGVLAGIGDQTVLLINSHEGSMSWRERLKVSGPILILPVAEEAEDRAELPFIGAACAGAAACLSGVVSKGTLEQAIWNELDGLAQTVIENNLEAALTSYELFEKNSGLVVPAEAPSAREYQHPEWIDLPFEDARVSAPTIHAAATSVEVRTGLWRTMRPIVDYERCHSCWWVCSTFCPDSAISVDKNGQPRIDYDHCKGCMICVAQCPSHAIEAIPEHEAQAADAREAQS